MSLDCFVAMLLAMTQIYTKNLYCLALSALIVLADQLSKWAVVEHVVRPILAEPSLNFIEWYKIAGDRLPYVQTEILPFFNLVMVWNQGVSFGLFNQTSNYGPLILSVLSLIITLGFVIWLLRVKDMLQILGIVMVIGGALGNVIDRARFGAVIDFLDFHLMGWHYPAFNLADSCVVVGVFILILHALFFEKKLQEQDEV